MASISSNNFSSSSGTVSPSPMMLLNSRRGRNAGRRTGLRGSNTPVIDCKSGSVLENKREASSQLRQILNEASKNARPVVPKKKNKSKFNQNRESNTLIFNHYDISGVYNNDINILEINIIIIDRLTELQESEKLRIKTELDIEVLAIKKSQNVLDRKDSIRKIKLYRDELINIDQSKVLNRYIEETREVLELYAQIGVKREVIDFGGRGNSMDPGHSSKTVSVQNNEENEYRIMLIEKYLRISRKYSQVDIYKKRVNCCNNCKSDISTSVIEEDGIMICSVCNVEIITLSHSITHDDGAVSSGSHHINNAIYEDRGNFEKALINYQGKQSENFPSNIYDKLDKYFISIGYPIGKEISQLPLNNDSRTSIKTRGNSSRSIMLTALQNLEMFKHYKDINLLGKIYWNWSLPDLTELEHDIMNDYDISQEVFERIKGGRKSCLNIQYRLWKHLTRIGHPCVSSDFKLIKTTEIIKFYESTWKIICEELGWNPGIPLI